MNIQPRRSTVSCQSSANLKSGVQGQRATSWTQKSVRKIENESKTFSHVEKIVVQPESCTLSSRAATKADRSLANWLCSAGTPESGYGSGESEGGSTASAIFSFSNLAAVDQSMEADMENDSVFLDSELTSTLAPQATRLSSKARKQKEAEEVAAEEEKAYEKFQKILDSTNQFLRDHKEDTLKSVTNINVESKNSTEEVNLRSDSRIKNRLSTNKSDAALKPKTHQQLRARTKHFYQEQFIQEGILDRLFKKALKDEGSDDIKVVCFDNNSGYEADDESSEYTNVYSLKTAGPETEVETQLENSSGVSKANQTMTDYDTDNGRILATESDDGYGFDERKFNNSDFDDIV